MQGVVINCEVFFESESAALDEFLLLHRDFCMKKPTSQGSFAECNESCHTLKVVCACDMTQLLLLCDAFMSAMASSRAYPKDSHPCIHMCVCACVFVSMRLCVCVCVRVCVCVSV